MVIDTAKICCWVVGHRFSLQEKWINPKHQFGITIYRECKRCGAKETETIWQAGLEYKVVDAIKEIYKQIADIRDELRRMNDLAK